MQWNSDRPKKFDTNTDNTAVSVSQNGTIFNVWTRTRSLCTISSLNASRTSMWIDWQARKREVSQFRIFAKGWSSIVSISNYSGRTILRCLIRIIRKFSKIYEKCEHFEKKRSLINTIYPWKQLTCRENCEDCDCEGSQRAVCEPLVGGCREASR